MSLYSLLYIYTRLLTDQLQLQLFVLVLRLHNNINTIIGELWNNTKIACVSH